MIGSLLRLVCLAIAFFGTMATCASLGPDPNTPVPPNSTKTDPGKQPAKEPGKEETRPAADARVVRLARPLAALRSPSSRLAPADHPQPASYLLLPSAQQRFVRSPRGLNLREFPSSTARVLLVLKHASAVRMTARSFRTEVLGKREGYWVRIEQDQRVGWVFDAFLADEQPPSEDHLTLAELYVRTKIRSRLVDANDGGQRSLGGIQKSAGKQHFQIATLKRLCGSGIADTSPATLEGELSFAVSYRWCSVDPGDIVRTRCVRCQLLRYRCSVSEADLRSMRNAKGEYAEPISCTVDRQSYCEKDCTEPLPLRD